MKTQVWQDPTIKEKLYDFNSVNFIDIDDPKNLQITNAYRVNAVPMIYIVYKKGAPVKAGSTMNVSQTLQFLS